MTVQQDATWTLVLPDSTLGSGGAPWPWRWSLSRILNRGRSRRLDLNGVHDVIGWAVTGHVASSATWAPAPVCWEADFGSDAPLGVIRIDPVHLAPGPRGLTLIPPEQLDINPAESQRLVDAVAGALRQRTTAVRAATPTRWYMSLAGAPDFRWKTPRQVSRCNVLECLPSGESAAQLRHLLNEIQIVLHHQPDNAVRREEGRPEINSIWPWGWADRKVPRVGSVVARVYSEHPYARGLAILAGVPVLEPVPDGREISGSGLVMPPAIHAGDAAWVESRWCQPLFRALAKGRVSKLRLLTESGLLIELDTRDRRRFWRRSGRRV